MTTTIQALSPISTITFALRCLGWAWPHINSFGHQEIQALLNGQSPDEVISSALRSCMERNAASYYGELEDKIHKKLLSWLNNPEKYSKRLLGLHEADIAIMRTCPTPWHIGILAEDLLDDAIEAIEETEKESVATKTHEYSAKAENRVEYAETLSLFHYERKTKAGDTAFAWRYEMDIRAQGLGAQVSALMEGENKSGKPTCLNLLSLLDEGKAINPIHWDKFWEQGMQVSGERLAWHTESYAYRLMVGDWDYNAETNVLSRRKGGIRGAFPSAIEFRAYNHSLGAPLLPHGMKPNCDIVLKHLTGVKAREEFHTMNPWERLTMALDELTLESISTAFCSFLPKNIKGLRYQLQADAAELFGADLDGKVMKERIRKTTAEDGTVTETIEEIEVDNWVPDGTWKNTSIIERLRRLHDAGILYVLEKEFGHAGVSRLGVVLDTYSDDDANLLPAIHQSHFWGLKNPKMVCVMKTDMSIGDDGSGRYHPEHPEMKDLVAKYGPSVFQIRGINEKGLFVKGIIVPDTRCVSDDEEKKPQIWISWLQVKGTHKPFAKAQYKAKATTSTKVHLGVMRTWNKRRFQTQCFEGLENMKNNEVTKKIVTELVTEYGQKLARGGVEAMLNGIAKDDKVIALILKLIGRAKELGIKIDPLKIDRINTAVKQRHGKALWVGAQGAGIRGRQQVIVMDATLCPGTCYSSHFAKGKKLAVWRFPMVLSQGLLVLENTAPSPHHMIRLMKDGKVMETPVREVIWMHPDDVAAIQGDDDGDIAAVSDDPRIVTLHENRLTENRYAIEPDGVALAYTPLDIEGRKYISQSPMGKVGIYTMARAKLLGAGDGWGALAMAVLVQESIDKAKRKVRWSNWEKAAQSTSWRTINGVRHLHWFKLVDGSYVPQKGRKASEVKGVEEESRNFWDQSENYPGDKIESTAVLDAELLARVQEWIRGRLKRAGFGFGASPIGWHIQEGRDASGETVRLRKTIDEDYWTESALKQGKGGERKTTGNLVHHSHDEFLRVWRGLKASFHVKDADTTMENLLPRLLAASGYTTEIQRIPWAVYEKTRAACGLARFSDTLSKAFALTDPDVKIYAVNAAYLAFENDIREWALAQPDPIGALALIWTMEVTPIWFNPKTGAESRTPITGWISKGRANAAFNAICWPGSPILELLCIEAEDSCDFLTPKKVKLIIDGCLAQPNAFKALAEKVYATPPKAQPGEEQKRTAHQVSKGTLIYHCQTCLDKLQNELVQHFRKAKARGEREFVSALVKSLNENQALVPIMAGEAMLTDSDIHSLEQQTDNVLQALAISAQSEDATPEAKAIGMHAQSVLQLRATLCQT